MESKLLILRLEELYRLAVERDIYWVKIGLVDLIDHLRAEEQMSVQKPQEDSARPRAEVKPPAARPTSARSGTSAAGKVS